MKTLEEILKEIDSQIKIAEKKYNYSENGTIANMAFGAVKALNDLKLFINDVQFEPYEHFKN